MTNELIRYMTTMIQNVTNSNMIVKEFSKGKSIFVRLTNLNNSLQVHTCIQNDTTFSN